MSTLHASGANVLVLNVTPQYAILAYLAAHKLGYIVSGSDEKR